MTGNQFSWPIGLAIYSAFSFVVLPGYALAKPLSYVCDFPTAKITLTYVFEDKEFGFADSDAPKMGKATLVGNAGTSAVIAVAGLNAISFVEPLVTGAVQTTTIQISNGKAIHSRHTLMRLDNTAEFLPSQARGTCKLLD